jgi:hypothetical protein
VSQQDPVPQMHIIVKRASSDTHVPARFQWSVTFKAPDAAGERYLGYRGSGTIEENLTGLQFEYGPAVLDERRPVWTTMNPTDRPDIRKQLTRLVTKAAEKLKLSGQDSFEHLLP